MTMATTSIAAEVERPGEFPRIWAERRPDALALVSSRGSLTWAGLETAIERLRADLAGRGVGPGDRVMMVTENCAATAGALCALNRLDAWTTLVNARMSAAEVDALIDFAEPRLVLFASGDSPAAAAHAARLGAAEWTDPDLGGIAAFATGGDPKPEPLGPVGERVALMMFTSGTTGTPKGVMLSNAALIYQAHSQGLARGLNTADEVWCIAPLSHMTGLASNLLAAFACGAVLRLPDRFEAQSTAEALRAGQVTFMVAVPQAFVRLLDWARENGVDLREGSRLRVLGSGGAPLEPSLQRRVKAELGVTVGNGYGCSEIVPIARVPPGVETEANVVGQPAPEIEVRLVGEDGGDVPDGAPGELWARGPARMIGYFRNPQATAEVIRDGGWLATGDIASRDPDGMIRIVGRKKELIIRSGFNVYPSDVEAVIADHPAVAMVAVLGRPVEGNEEVVAFVQLKPGETLDEAGMKAWLRERLSPYKLPAEIRAMELPIGPTGKILKNALKSEL
ncbi:Acyl-CoA synthetase (AMP-forming)/AMP-acid ligase II [Albimonas donghaensis]|uniref:Acyl-CoA synthetase (AMP-forming)/AMP-acid ligase II n=1 Tax=Albimonas donghaensis TaxID=356660 RepID=A0A1H3EQ80_9RHOB|nr:class I adenylate-forming enzyme family protein [Albimonas donghaensis]SDX80278.1 Acyl-CoA synthetase (AMP-forming)/AMP-acid ligase II [Albimonas donghaensis]